MEDLASERRERGIVSLERTLGAIMHEAARSFEHPGKQNLGGLPVDDLQGEDRGEVGDAGVALIPGYLGTAPRAHEMRNLVLMKSHPLAIGAEIIWEVVLGHGSDLDKTPFEGVSASSSQSRFQKRWEDLPEWQVGWS